jgi:hypothetical protein
MRSSSDCSNTTPGTFRKRWRIELPRPSLTDGDCGSVVEVFDIDPRRHVLVRTGLGFVTLDGRAALRGGRSCDCAYRDMSLQTRAERMQPELSASHAADDRRIIDLAIALKSKDKPRALELLAHGSVESP